MEYRKFGNDYVVRLERGEEIITAVSELCEKENIRLGSVSGIGASDHAVIGLFDTEKQEYLKTELKGPMEITSLVGNISRMDGNVYLHFHINLCDEKMLVHGGHLNEAHISATAEIFIHALDGEVGRRHDESVGLNLFEFEK